MHLSGIRVSVFASQRLFATRVLNALQTHNYNYSGACTARAMTCNAHPDEIVIVVASSVLMKNIYIILCWFV